MPITTKQRGPSGYAVGLSNATETYLLNAATTLGANAVSETVQSMSISEIMWTGDWTIARGANTVFDTAAATTQGHFDFQASGMRLEDSVAQLTSSCVCTLTGAGSLLIKFHKSSGE